MTEEKKENRLVRIDKAEVVMVIRVTSVEGSGTDEDPVRRVFRYWTVDGKEITGEA